MIQSPFTEAQILILRAVVDRIIPEDEFSGAWNAGVGTYISRLIADDTEAIQQYQLGLTGCDQEASSFLGHSFVSLSSVDQDAILSRIELGRILTEWEFDPKAFFRMVVDHTMEGFYADPGNGGNLDEVAWKMIGFEVTA